MTKALIVACILAFGFAPQVFAQSGFVPLAPIPGLTDAANTSVVNSATLANFFNNLYKYLIGLAAVLAVIMIIWGGLEISTQDSVSKQGAGRERITEALLGLVLVLAPVLVFSVINPSILNLSINFQELNLAPGATTTPATSGGGGVDTGSGCTVTGVSGILQIATCPTEAASETWGRGCVDGVLSSITPLSIAAGGGAAQNIITCASKKEYVFIETIGVASLSGAINRIQPLAVTASNPNNAAEAIQFKNICKSIGWRTVISDNPFVTFQTECLPKPTTTIPSSSGGSGKCYKERLSCADVPPSVLADKDPSWSPFQ